MHKCVACDKTLITWRFAICRDCEKVYGNKATEWPEWLRFRWNDIQRQRRRERRILQHEISFSELEKEEEDYEK